MIIQYETKNSLYEVDDEKKLIRRVGGVNPPTDNFGFDDDWIPYQEVEVGHRLTILFGTGRLTITSPLRSAKWLDR